jgi:ferredoxin
MKVHIDQEGCIECGLCQQTCAEIFILESGEKASIVEKYQKNAPNDGEVPDSLESCASDAAESCPVQVITAI